MASDMLGGVLPIGNSACLESTWGEKAHAYVVLHPHQCDCFTYTRISVSHGGGAVVRYWPNLPIRYQHPHLSRDPWQDRRRPLRNIFHASIRRHDLGLLVKYNRRRLAHADIRGEHVHMMALLPRSSSYVMIDVTLAH